MDAKVLGFEIGASKLIALAGNTLGTVFSKITTKTKNSEATHDVLFNQLDTLYSRLSKKYKAKYIGITFPGAVSKKGIVVYTPNMPGWKKYNLLKEAEKRFGLKVFVENDANAQALAEKLYGYADILPRINSWVPHGFKVRFNHCRTIRVHSNGLPQGVPEHPLLLSHCLATVGFGDTFSSCLLCC